MILRKAVRSPQEVWPLWVFHPWGGLTVGLTHPTDVPEEPALRQAPFQAPGRHGPLYLWNLHFKEQKYRI